MATQSKISKTLEEIKEILQNYPEGALIDDIEAGMPSCPPRRTLQRRLLSLQKAGELSVAGKTQGMRYFLSLGKLTEPPIHPEPAIPLSNQAKSILRQVGRPLQQRIPVGYRRAFLDGYQPNVSADLTDSDGTALSA